MRGFIISNHFLIRNSPQKCIGNLWISTQFFLCKPADGFLLAAPARMDPADLPPREQGERFHQKAHTFDRDDVGTGEQADLLPPAGRI